MNSSNDQSFAPGCFGSALTYSDDDTCKSCPFSAECSVKSQLALKELRVALGVTVKERRRSSEVMSHKAEEIFNRLGKTVQEIKSALLSGNNPFSVRNGFMGDVCFVLLNSQQVTRAFLAQVIASRCKVRETVAAIYARQAIQILRHCEVLEENEGSFSLRRGLK